MSAQSVPAVKDGSTAGAAATHSKQGTTMETRARQGREHRHTNTQGGSTTWGRCGFRGGCEAHTKHTRKSPQHTSTWTGGEHVVTGTYTSSRTQCHTVLAEMGQTWPASTETRTRHGEHSNKEYSPKINSESDQGRARPHNKQAGRQTCRIHGRRTTQTLQKMLGPGLKWRQDTGPCLWMRAHPFAYNTDAFVEYR